MICLGIEGTAEKTGIGIVEDNGKILSLAGRQLYPLSGGIHPREAADHHAKMIPKLIKEAIEKANISLNEIDIVSFSRGPGLGPALRTTATASRALALSLDIPIIGVNHCIGHIEIGKLDTGANDPLSLYVSGGNSQVIAYEYGRYRVFGETLDIAIGNALDQFGRETGLPHPGGPVIEKLAKSGNYIDLPYSVKGMDLSFSGLMSAATRKYVEGIAIEDICFSFQETAFSMLVEVTERALSHTKKDEVMLCGGVAANKRLQEMLDSMANDHYANFYMPKMEYCGDNGVMIAWLGILMNDSYGSDKLENTNVIQRFRTDEVNVPWVVQSKNKIKLPKEILAKGAESDIYSSYWMDEEAISKVRIPKNYRIKEIDEKIRKSRTKKEAKLLREVKRLGVRSPILFDIDLAKKAIVMEKINGTLFKDYMANVNDGEGKSQFFDVNVNDGEGKSQFFDVNVNDGEGKSQFFNENVKDDERKNLAIAIGQSIGLMHKGDIIHGDITSSNIMIKDNGQIIFIDFGLGKDSNLIEDKCVDLIVLKKSLQSVDYQIANETFEHVLDGYISSYNQNDFNKEIIIEKIREIQSRGRYTH